jgi:hypothetical protein
MGIHFLKGLPMDILADGHFQEKTQLFKRFAFAVWLLLVGGVAAAIAKQERFFVVSIKPVATLEKKIGGAVARSEGVVRWRELVTRDGLYDGDMVATGEDGKVRIRLGADRVLTLGESTQVKITAISSSGRDFSFLIKLIRGTASGEVSSDCSSCGPIIIRAGEETFRVIAGKQLGVSKEAGSKPVQKFKPTAPDWAVPPKPAVEKVAVVSPSFIQAAPVVVPEPVVVKTPRPAPPPVAVVVPAAPLLTPAMEASVEAPQDGLDYWTLEPLVSLKTKGIAYPITLPTARPERGEWRPRFEVTDAAAKRPSEVPNSGLTGKSLYVGLDRALSSATINTRGAIKLYTFGVRGGAAVISGKERGQSMNTKPIVTRVYSIPAAFDGPVSIGLDALNERPLDPSTHWLISKQLIDVNAAPVGLHLASGNDYANFLPFIRGATRIGLSDQGLVGQTGLFVVRKQEVVAELTGANIDKSVLDKVMLTMNADFIFRGARSALYDVRATSQAALADTIGALLDKGKVLYLMKRNKIYPVSRDFIKTSSEVASFVDTQAMAIFLQSVEIVNYH